MLWHSAWVGFILVTLSKQVIALSNSPFTYNINPFFAWYIYWFGLIVIALSKLIIASFKSPFLNYTVPFLEWT